MQTSWHMQALLLKMPAIALAAIFALGTFDAALAREKKPRVEPPADSAIERDANGTPIIMRDEDSTKRQRVERPRTAPRGSGGYYVPPPVPSPYAGPPAPGLMKPPPAPYVPPPINSFGDRVINCIHSYPLNAGIGNNPTDRQMYIRQCANN